eukprot:330900-Rhodomonas_salina.2
MSWFTLPKFYIEVDGLHAFAPQRPVLKQVLLVPGEANLSQKDRPVIVYRYDDPATPAPGTNFIGTQALAWYGWARA